MASCIKQDGGEGPQQTPSRKKRRGKKKRKGNTSVVKVEQKNPIGRKRSFRRNRRRNLVKIQMACLAHFPKAKKKKQENNNNKKSGTVVASNSAVNSKPVLISSNDSVIVCDSDSEVEPIKDVIEIYDSATESFFANENDASNSKEKEESKDGEVICLDDVTENTSADQAIWPSKRLRLDDDAKKTEEKASAAAPNSIVVVVSNTPTKKYTADGVEIIDLVTPPVEKPKRLNSAGDDSSSTKHNNANCPSKPQETFNFLPLSTDTDKFLSSFETIKITLNGNNRSFSKTSQSQSSSVNTASTSTVATLPSSTVTTNLLPKLTAGSIFGGNLYNAGTLRREGLRDIVIDGSNVAMGHSNGKFFSVKGLKICIDYFLQRGHRVRAFVPHHRIKSRQSSNPMLLKELSDKGIVILTPSREVNGRKVVCYDDRLLVQCAAELEAVVVSGDNYRDLLWENPSLRETIEKRLLIPTWVDDMIIFPSDPLGRYGPSLDRFLRFP